MPSPGLRAERACSTCRRRKKGCDKTLPSCGYCNQRDLSCSYDWHEDDDDGNSGNSGAGLTSPETSAPAVGVSPAVVSNALHRAPPSLDEMLHLYVCDVHNLTGLGMQEMVHRYLHGAHTWLPVIYPGALIKAAEIGGSAPPAGDSLLLLVVCLIAVSYAQLSKVKSNESLYVSVKRLFGHVQAASGASLALVKTSLLLNAYEFATGNPEAAFVTIASCARMAYLLGLDAELDSASQTDSPSSKSVEATNVWWGIVVLERLIISVLPSRLYFPITVYPATTARLPLDFTAASNRTDVSDCKSHHYDAHNHDVGSFGLQTQSVRLLDEVCSFRKQSEHDLDRYLPEAAAIDARLWQFMSVVIDECGRNRAFSCGSIGTAGRAVHILHLHILTHLRPASWKYETQLAQSHTALKSATRIMFDASVNHVAHRHPDHFPLCGRYNTREAITYLNGYATSMTQDDLDRYKSAILKLEYMFLERWGSLGPGTS